jgi:hypothetical protein
LVQIIFRGVHPRVNKKKAKLNLARQVEWEDYFLQESKKVHGLQSRIQTTDHEIDQMVYALFGLTEEEIIVVEG